ncbi:TIGR01777 family oxidoreductase [Spirosoma jeollabukense]
MPNSPETEEAMENASKYHILITGGNGLVGKPLTQALLAEGYQVSHLSRTPSIIPGVTTYGWDVVKQQIDARCLDGVDTIIHLAGADIAGEAWTPTRKQEISRSRTESIRLLYRLMGEQPHGVKSVISASGIAFYGDRSDEILTEQSQPSPDFLGTVCQEWEDAVGEGESLGLRVVTFRTGVVLTQEGGALASLAPMIQSGFGASLGSGRQWVPWIHLQDVVGLYCLAVRDSSLTGVFNQTAPGLLTNRHFVEAQARHFHKPLWMPSIPAFMLKLMMGEQSAFVLNSARAVPSERLLQEYRYQYPTLDKALNAIYA